MKKLLSGIATACFLLCVLTASRAETAILTFGRDSLTLSVGRYITLTASVEPYGAIREGAVYSISDESVASVDKNGKVRGLQAGECELTAVSKYDETVSVTIPVYVIVPVEQLKLTAALDSIIVEDTLQLTAAILPEDATMQRVLYSSSDESILTVSKKGLVTGIGHGQATVTAESADGRASDKMSITVKQPPESVTVSPDALTLAVGKSEKLEASVLPAKADDKTVLWTSSDESVASVSERGTVTGVRLGETVINAICKDNTNAWFDVPVTVYQLATGVSFAQDSYEVTLGESMQLNPTVFPADTSNQSVTYSVYNDSILSVDEYGTVTALKGGKTTVTVSTVDGSRKSDTATIRVLVPLTGVSYPCTDIRVGAGYYGHFTVNPEPSDATNVNLNMTWEIADTDIATVSGDTTTFKIVGGDDWGRTAVTGVTEDGGFTITLNVNVGSINRAVTVKYLDIRSGKPYIILMNNSDMVITQVSYSLKGLDSNYQPIKMSSTSDGYTLYGTYNSALYPNEQTQTNLFSFTSPSNFEDLTYLRIAVTGWSTSTGYYDSDGILQYDYSIAGGNQPTAVHPSGTDASLF